jgi:hypothetical protein
MKTYLFIIYLFVSEKKIQKRSSKEVPFLGRVGFATKLHNLRSKYGIIYFFRKRKQLPNLKTECCNIQGSCKKVRQRKQIVLRVSQLS